MSEHNRIDSLLEQVQSGKLNLSADAPTTPELMPELGIEETEVEPVDFSAPEQTVEQTEPEIEDSEQALADTDADTTDVSLEDSSTQGTASPSEDIFELKVTGPKGPQKVKVDLSDKEKIKNYVRLAHGARKWQKERDDTRLEAKKLQEELTGFKKDWQQIEEAYKLDGVKGLVNLLEKNDAAYDKFVEQEFSKRKEWESLSPSQQELIRQKEEIARSKMEQEKLRKSYEEQLNQIQTEKQQVFEKQLESKIHPSFDRYRFSGKLGDPQAESEFDEMLWGKVMGRLDNLSAETDLTQAIIDREFRMASQSLAKHLNKQVETAVSKTIQDKKQAANTKIIAAVKKGNSGANGMTEMREKLKSGNLTEAISDFFKLGGKVK